MKFNDWFNSYGKVKFVVGKDVGFAKGSELACGCSAFTDIVDFLLNLKLNFYISLRKRLTFYCKMHFPIEYYFVPRNVH